VARQAPICARPPPSYGLLRLHCGRSAMATRPEDLIYAVDEWPPWPKLVLLGLQQAILASVYLVLLVIVARAAGVPDRMALAIVSLGMIALGISTALQAIWKGPVGSGYLAVPVFSAIYLAPALLAAKTGGLPAVFGMTMFAGLVEVVLSQSLRRLRALIPPAISGLVVAVVGLDLGLVGVDHLLGVDAYNDPSFRRHVAVPILTLAIAVGSSVWSKGLMRLMCSAIAVAVGSVIALFMGLIPASSLARVMEAPALALPDPSVLSYSFWPGLIPAFLIAGVAAALRTVGVVTTCQKINDRDWKRPDMRSIEGGVLADGLGCMGAGLLGTMGMNTGPSLVGVAKASGATSRYIAFACAAILLLFSFVPKIAAVFLILPLSVVGSALVFTASFMIAGGVQIMVSRNIDTRMTLRDRHLARARPQQGRLPRLLRALTRVPASAHGQHALADPDRGPPAQPAVPSRHPAPRRLRVRGQGCRHGQVRGVPAGARQDMECEQRCDQRGRASTMQVLEHISSAHLVQQGSTRFTAD
jgi:xanthine permease XanP